MALIALVALALLLPGCRKDVRATAAHRVDMNLILPPAATFIEVPTGKVFLMAATVETTPPAYPPALLDAGIALQKVCAEIEIGEDGAVHAVTPLYALPECPDPEDRTPRPFVQAVTNALSQWQFLAAAFCTFPPGVPSNDECEGRGVEVQPVAIKLAYVFEFVNDGGEVAVKGTQRQAR